MEAPSAARPQNLVTGARLLDFTVALQRLIPLKLRDSSLRISSQFERIDTLEEPANVEILNSRVIKQFIAKHPDAEAPLTDWVTKTRAAEWKNNSDVQKTFNRADHLGDQKFIFNIGGNNFRMAAMVWIEQERVYVLKLMTHTEYDKEKF